MSDTDIDFLTKWADDINASSGKAVDADRLRDIAERLRSGRAAAPPPDWADVFDAQKSVIGFLRETLATIKRENQHYNFGSKLVRIVDEALSKVPEVEAAASRAAVWAECVEECAKVADAFAKDRELLAKRLVGTRSEASAHEQHVAAATVARNIRALGRG